MPRKKVNEEIPEPIQVVNMAEDDSDVESLLTEVGSASKYVAIKRQHPTTKEWEYVARYDLPIDNLMDRVKEEHGGGKYTGRICHQGGDYIKGLTFSIDSRFRPAPVTTPPVIGVASATPPSEGLSEVKELLKQLIALQMTPKHDPLEVGLRIAEAMRRGPSDIPLAPVVSSIPPWSEMFSIFKQGMEMGATAGGGEGLGYLPVIEKLGGPLVEILGKVANKSNPTVAKVNGGTPLPKPTPTTPDQYISKYLPQIISLALSKKDPTLYADVILDQIPESQYDYLYGVVTRPDVIPFLTTLHPGVKEHEAWFLELTKAIREALTPESEEIPSFSPEDAKEGEPTSSGMDTDE